MELTLSASNPLGAIGSLVQPARKTRRRNATGALVGSQNTSSTAQSLNDQAVVGSQRTSRVYAREAIVEAMSDVALVELVLVDNQDAFTVLVERYKDAVQNLAYRMLSNTTEAEDVTQETFVRAIHNLLPISPPINSAPGYFRSPRTWQLTSCAAVVSWRYHSKMCPSWNGSPMPAQALSNLPLRVSNRTRFRSICNAYQASIVQSSCCATGMTSPMKR